jgi:hypothetical protein
MTASKALLAPVLFAALSLPATAQGVGDVVVATLPQYVSIKIGSGASSRTVSQLSVPLVVVVPISSRLNFDLSTAFASSEVAEPGLASSTISGLTDTQVRANLTLGNDDVVLTFGANLPTGRYEITDEEVKAAGQIGSDFLMFPVSSYGAGLSTTGGIAVARSLGAWNVGIAGSFRKSTEFDAFRSSDATTSETLTFTPADEVRARVGLDRLFGNNKFSAGLTYSTFGEDQLAKTSYATGDRFLGQASLHVPVGGTDVYVSGWGLYRAKGQQYGGVANPETVLNGAVSLAFQRGNVQIEPSIEGRNWQVDGAKSGLLGTGGVRLRWTTGVISFTPTATYQVGTLYSSIDGSSIDVTGWRASLTLRIH